MVKAHRPSQVEIRSNILEARFSYQVIQRCVSTTILTHIGKTTNDFLQEDKRHTHLHHHLLGSRVIHLYLRLPIFVQQCQHKLEQMDLFQEVRLYNGTKFLEVIHQFRQLH